jgi:hypothetical protein
MVYEVLSLVVITFLFSGIILWVSLENMISKKSISSFLPFFFLGLVLSFYAATIAFELFFTSVWALLESSVLLSLVWIFINIWRNNK